MSVYLYHMLMVEGDHSLLLPALYKKGYRNPIICSYETLSLLPPMFRDSAFIMNKECEALSKKKGIKVEPIYNESDANNTVDLLTSYSLDEIHKIDDVLSFRFLRNGHILGAVQIELFFTTESNKIKKILYTGDIANLVHKKPFVEDTEFCKTANLAFFESTYGFRDKNTTKQDRKNDINLIKNMVEDVIFTKHGCLLTPIFSLDRCQHMLKIFYDLYHDDERMADIPIYIDSKLAMAITSIYKKILTGDKLELIKTITEWENVKFIKDYNESSYCAKDKESKIVLSASGFMQGGHVNIYAQEYLGNPNNGILFCGYSSENSIAGKIKNQETKSVKIDTKICKKKCRIESLKTLSSHINSLDLIKYMKMINCGEIILIHGDKKAKQELKEDADIALREIGKTTKITISQKDMKIII